MKRHIGKMMLTLFFLNSFGMYPQLDSLKSEPNFTKHLTFSDTFFGNEEMYQVCYPKDHRSMFYFIIIFSVTTLVLGFLLIYMKYSSNKKLKEKNGIISEQNKDLIDSINYAQRIQQAILPDHETEEEILKNGFVLYKPKHIVSGDFYWLHNQNNLIFIAVIDCTGHGVPGALLTMLAYNAINKAVIEKELQDPRLILSSMNNDIKIALKQHQNKNMQDSMEVALVCLNTDTNNLLFAGANLSLSYIKNGALNIIRGGKTSVGSVQDGNLELPKTHSLNLDKGDSFYLYTDGFADQFGGPKARLNGSFGQGKKYKYKQLENLLLSNHTKPVHEQKNSLDASFENWKGNLEQVDDVTIIGIRI